MLFWGLPIALIGVAAMGVGIALGMMTYRRFKGRTSADVDPKDL